MDITTLFKACVKTVRTRNKALGEKDKKTNILKRSCDIYLSRARNIIKHINELNTYLNENKKLYINVVNHFSSAKPISDFEREEIEKKAEDTMNICLKLMQEFKNDCANFVQTRQVAEHYANVILSTENYMKNVGKMYAEYKAIRLKRALENRKISKLEAEMSPGKRKQSQHEKTQEEKKLPVIPDKAVPINPEDQLTTEEMQMFESENEFLYNELNSISEEIQQIESKVVHISELQEIFTEKVLQQEKDIERIATTVINSTENVKDANEQIRQAIQRNAGLRVWVLFFLLVMSFSLLFLDWYND